MVFILVDDHTPRAETSSHMCQDHSYVALSAPNNVERPQVSDKIMLTIRRAMYS